MRKRDKVSGITYVVDVDAAEIRVVLAGQHVDTQTGRRVAVAVDRAGRTSFAIASRPIAHVHHAYENHRKQYNHVNHNYYVTTDASTMST